MDNTVEKIHCVQGRRPSDHHETINPVRNEQVEVKEQVVVIDSPNPYQSHANHQSVPATNEEQIVAIAGAPESRHSQTEPVQGSPARSSSTQSSNLLDKIEASLRKLDSVKNGIIVLCSLFATFCFEAILNPPGGLWQTWQSSTIINATEVARAVNLTKSSTVHVLNSLSFFGHFPHLNFTAPELLGPNKAMSITLDPYRFLVFLHSDAVCFIASLLTVAMVMVTTSWDSLSSQIILHVMIYLVLISAFALYTNVLTLVSNEQFASWTFEIGVSVVTTVSGIYLLTRLCFSKKFWKVTGMVCVGIGFLFVLFFKSLFFILKQLVNFLRC